MVYVVDDEVIIADMTSLILRAAGFQVHTFYDGAEVLSNPTETPPDILVTDYWMPRVNGLVLAEWVQKHYPQCRVVMISGHANLLPEMNRKKYFTLLSKPIHPEKLIKIIKQAA